MSRLSSLYRTTTEDERSDKYHRLLAASLQAFSLYVSALSDDQREEMTDKLRPLLESNKFWKFGKHAVGVVRCRLLRSDLVDDIANVPVVMCA